MQNLTHAEPQAESDTMTKASGRKLFLIDGTAFCYRAYYAIRHLSNSKGEATNAIYGFVTMLQKLFNEQKPDYVVVCFDRKEATFRHEAYEDYKAHRKPPPDDLIAQFEPIKVFCRALNYTVCEKAGFEADDLLGTLAYRGAKDGLDVYIVTGDKDAFQLVGPHVRILNPSKDSQIYDTAAVRERFDGLGPEKVTDLMAIMGDSSDNIPGVPGIGEKGALKLIKEFGSVENLYKFVSKVKSPSQQALLKEHKEKALLSKRLARIDTEVPLEIDWEKTRLSGPDAVALADLCKRYEFKNMLKALAPAGEENQSSRDYRTVETAAALNALARELKKAGAFSFDTETTSADPLRAELVGLSFSTQPMQAVYVPVSSQKHAGPGLALAAVLEVLGPLLEDEKLHKYGQNAKYDWMVLKRHGVNVRGITFDTMIASYLINPVKLNHNLDDISFDYLNVKKIATEALLGKGKTQRTMDQVPLAEIAEYAAEDADCVFRLVPILSAKLKEHGLEKLFREVEIPLSICLGVIEMNGVTLDLKLLKELSNRAADDLESLTKTIYKEAGEEFNINSTKQLADILFERLKLPTQKKTKTGYSTDVTVLEKLAAEGHELPKKLLEYREKTKLKSTYLDALPEMVNPETGRVHTSYHQTTTVTGRLSSSDPNLQNIPIKTAEGRAVRKAFVSRYGKKGKLLSADYSQIELRLLAHLSGDKNLVKAFKADRDIHKFTATLLYGVDEEGVTREMRDAAKTINFSIIYGKTAYGLSQDLGLSVPEADLFIQNYFKRYSAIKEYLDSQKELAHQQGYLLTILGRRSYFPEINAANGQLRQFAERAAINAPIQGSAADLIKLAMLRVQERLQNEEPECFMIMQVHDELVLDVPAARAEAAAKLVRSEMEAAYTLNVPLKVDVFTGDSWFKN